MSQIVSEKGVCPEDNWLTIPTAQKYLSVSRATLYRLMQQGVLPYYRITGTRQRRFKQSELDQLLVREDPEAVLNDKDASDDAE